MPVPVIRIEDGKMYRSMESFAWVDYPMGSASDEVKALTDASTKHEPVQIIGPEFSIQGTISVMSMGNGAKFRVVRSD
ncbi:hypothetical protein [Deinococcus sp. QL22]|uniref:hypothetical protein n=1 Tax=Deinococcus sp. QL22 TaxID=2939437 RepID=UPI002017D206|nr:hypothetical protein [Deinococcus sp. QL22]UQN10381.1 hypothetical protein M1R55_29965 [Deinococcus sp. QL22]UQN10515.1 hypothetical protein M1R55_29290 [Deinococcus sp. QL22]